MNVVSVCTGIGGFDLGLKRAGMRVVAQCESDGFCRRVLAQYWPGVPCFEDIRTLTRTQLNGRWRQLERERHGADIGDRPKRRARRGGIDLIAAGTPCQDLSIAGRRAGLIDGERSSLFFEFARLADELVRPGGWLLFENVPGLLSSPGGSRSGRDFAVVLATLADIGFHDLAYRVLDSRYFGVPQRRRRVYIVARRASGDGAREVLLEPESGGGDFAPGREAGTRVAASPTSGSHGAGVRPPGRRQQDDENIIAPLAGGGRRGHRVGAEEAAGGHLVANALVSRYGKGTDSDATDMLITGTVRSHMRPGSASEDLAITGPVGGGNNGAGRRSEDDPNLVCEAADADGVREAAGLPGWVDDPLPDGPRYSACGNAVTVPVIEWIGRRIMSVATGEHPFGF